MPSRLAVVLVSLLVATPAVIFWLWLVILPARVAILCPESCRCDTGGYYVDCSGSGLNNIPSIFPTNVRQLWLHGNNITSLEKDSFISRGLTELEKLTAHICRLETMEVGAFNGLTELTHLILSHNKIRNITPGTFEEMGRLEYLDLGFNRIEHLEVDALSKLSNLNYIDLRGNKLQYLHPDIFVGMPNLAKMKLDYNRNLQIPNDRHFISSHSLSHLEITDCNVNSVSVETFANVTALEWLDLGVNNLRSVDINILKVLPKLSTMYLSGNPLQCDCQLQEVWRWCQHHYIQTAYRGTEPECDTPNEVQGIWWGVLERGLCLQDNIYYDGHYENASYNYTATEDTDSYTYIYDLLQKCELLLSAIPFIFGTTGNVILLIIIICNKDMRTVPNMYILNLAISDIICLTVQFGKSCADTIYANWLYGNLMCKFIPFCRSLSVGLSAYTVAVLSIQRYRVTVNPLHVRVSSQPTWRATVATISGLWIVAELFALPSAISGKFCDMSFYFSKFTYYQRVVLFELLVSCVLPLCMIAFSYIMTARHLLKSARPISGETRSPQLKTRTNTARIVLGLTVVFLISYVPYHVFWIFLFSTDHWMVSPDLYIKSRYAYIVSTCLLLISPCLNPVALFCTSFIFRRQFKRYLTCYCKANPTGVDIELTRRN